MKYKFLKGVRSIALIAVITLISGGCKGRTTDNVEPSGDTVEVVIATPEAPVDSTPSDTIP